MFYTLLRFNHSCRYIPDDILEIAKSTSVMFTFNFAQSIHCKIVAVIGDSKSHFSIEINDQLHLIKLVPLIQDELNLDMFFESGVHYDIQMNMSISFVSETISIFLQSSAVSSEVLDQSCFACKNLSSLRPIQVDVQHSPASYLSKFDCKIELNTNQVNAIDESFL
jgi:hypothetical protein